VLYTLIVLKVCLLCILFFLAACFSCSETALFSLGRVKLFRIKEEKQERADSHIVRLLEDPRRLLVTIIIGNELVNILSSTLTASITDTVFANIPWTDHYLDEVIQTIIGTVILVPLLVLFGDYLPKTLAIMNPERFARKLSAPLDLFAKSIAPIRWVMESFASVVIRMTLGSSHWQEAVTSEAEFRVLVDLGKEEGEIAESEREIIHNIFDFGDTSVSEVMTPRTDMVCVNIEQEWDEILSLVAEEHYSRTPVYENDKDNIVGVLYSKDLLAVDPGRTERKEFNLRTMLRKPYFIPHSKKANDLFREFQFHRVHMAIVVDEYGGVAGLVTMEDLLEELFGEILDEYDPEEFIMRRVDDRTAVISSRMTIDEFNWRLGAHLPADEYDTMGGLVFGLFGRLPTVGSQVSFSGCTFTVEKMQGTRILEIRVSMEKQDTEGVVQ